MHYPSFTTGAPADTAAKEFGWRRSDAQEQLGLLDRTALAGMPTVLSPAG